MNAIMTLEINYGLQSTRGSFRCRNDEKGAITGLELTKAELALLHKGQALTKSLVMATRRPKIVLRVKKLLKQINMI